MNHKKSEVMDFQLGEWKTKLWKNIEIGSLIKVNQNEEIPADLLIIKSSKTSGIAFLDTMNLDGETNLKERIAPKETKDLDDLSLHGLRAKLVYDRPNANLENWDGNIVYSALGGKIINVGAKQMLLRGCFLRNTEFIYGIVVYAGHATKIMMNSRNPPSKMSNVLKRMNELLYTVFIFQLVIIIIFAGLSIDWRKDHAADHKYLDIVSFSFNSLEK